MISFNNFHSGYATATELLLKYCAIEKEELNKCGILYYPMMEGKLNEHE